MKRFRAGNLRASIQVAGILITIAALAFAVHRTWMIGQASWDRLLSGRVLGVLLLGGIVYGLAGFLLAWAWQKLLIWFGEPAGFRLGAAVYGRTQIAKYLPGNLFHFPGRHLMGRQVGFRHPALIGAAIYEIVGLVISAGMIALVGFPAQVTALGDSIIWPLTIILLFLLVPLAIQFFVSHFKIGQKLGFPERSVYDAARHLLPVLAIHTLFFLVAGEILRWIVGMTTDMWSGTAIRFVLSTFAISWLAGFITPGAPAGIGVREATMILILSGYIGEPAAALVAIISRLVVTIGDLEFFVLSHIYKLESIDKSVPLESS